ncbi:MAG: KPN_02809 family neutral zinc metallopeptidase [Gemmatimonadaceae bacterium]
MRWTPGRRSVNLEDRRGQRMTGGGLGLGGGGFGRMGLGGLVVVIILSLVFKQDFLGLLGGAAGDTGANVVEGPVASTPEEERQVEFVSFVLDDAQDNWTRIFANAGQQYRPATLVLYRDATQTACGFGQAASGPFYCPGDAKVYVDLGFFDDLHSQYGATGDFAQAYVLAHEIGHHVQSLLGTEREVRRLQSGNPGGANALSVRMELQADCYAGIWARSTEQRDILERGDVDEGLAAAAAVGDDRLQRMGGGRVNPDAFTHGTSEERMRWFQQGFSGGELRSCDTFADVR